MNSLKTKILLLLAVVFFAFTIQPPKSGYEIGDLVADFSLKNVDGNTISLSDYKEARGFVIVFTCNSCPCSQANENRLNKLNEKFSSQGYPVIAINSNDPDVSPKDSFEKMKERAQEKKFTYPYLFDEGQKVYPVFGATKTPQAYILNKRNNKLIVSYIGAIDDSVLYEEKVKEKYVENALNSIIQGKKPEKEFTKAIGCIISRKPEKK